MPRPHPYTATDGTTTWRVRFRLDKRNCSETFTAKRDAERFCSDIATRGARAALRLLDAEHAPTGPKLDDVFADWIAWKAGRVRSDRTVADYRRDYTNWIQPALGGRAVTTLDETDVQRLVDDMSTKLSPKSVADRHAILHGILKWAAHPSRHLVDTNVAIGTDLPKRRRTQPKGLRPLEWQALYASLVQIDHDAADLALFLLATGWRFSEASALEPFDVEDDGRTVHVSLSQVVRRNAAGQSVVVEDGKSDAAMRRIKLDADVADMVRRRIGVRTDGLVFATKRGAKWSNNNFRDRYWDPAVKTANLARKPTPHWLRHTSVAWLVMTGKVSLPEIQRRIGHESIKTTIDVYGRLIDDVSADALEAFAALRGDRAQPQLTSSDDRQVPRRDAGLIVGDGLADDAVSES